MKVRKMIATVLCFLIGVIVLISLLFSLLEIKNRDYSKETYKIYGLLLVFYVCTIVFKTFGNMIIQAILVVFKIFIIIGLFSLITISYDNKWLIFLEICNFVAYVGYAAEQTFRLVYWLDANESQ